MTDTVNTAENIAAAPEAVKILLDEDQPTPAPVPAPVPPATDSAEVEYEPTGDVGLDLALQFVGKAGIGADHPAMSAARTGDFSLIKATLASKGVQGWEAMTALGEEAYKRLANEAKSRADAVAKTVHAIAGGTEAWSAVQQWASSNATQEEKAEINALLDKGGLQAKAAAKYLVDMYNKANNVTVDPKDPTQGATRSGTVGTDQGPLDGPSYAKAVQELNTKLRGRIDGSPEYLKIQQRRLAWRG